MTAIVERLFAKSVGTHPVRNLYMGEGAQLYGGLVANDELEFEEIRNIGELLEDGASVGELASGDGRLLFSIGKDKVSKYFALDSSAVLLSQLSHRVEACNIDARQVRILCQDLLAWTPEKDMFDLLIFGAGTVRLFDAKQRSRIFNLSSQALRPGGYLYVSTSEPLEETEKLLCLGQIELRGKAVVPYFYTGELPEIGAREIGFAIFTVGTLQEHSRVYSSVVYDLTGEELSAEMRQAGFEIKRITAREHTGIAGLRERTTAIVGRIGG